MFGKEKVELKTNKLYYGFPVILLGYKDDRFKYNASTTSSSYTLGNTITVGIVADTAAAKQIRKYGEFSVNVATETIMEEIEICGFFSKHNKLQQADLPYTVGKYADVPLVDDCFLCIECKVKEIIELEGYIHIVGEILRRVVDEDLASEDRTILLNDKVRTVHFLGCSSKRVYRYLNEDIDDLGKFVENGTNICG